MTGHITYHDLEREAEQHAHKEDSHMAIWLVILFLLFVGVPLMSWADNWQFNQTRGE